MRTPPILLLLSFQLQAGSHETATQFFETHHEAAQQLEYCNGIPTELSLAVWALESGYGTSKAAQNNNLGGIASYKGGSKHWAKYRTLSEFYTAYAAIFDQPCYSNDLQPKTVNEYLEAMEWGCCSYHRSKKYTRKIKWIIKNFKLEQMNKELKIFNGYAGLGGNRKKWTGNIKVTAMELDTKIAKVYKGQFPQDELIIGDVHEYLINNFMKFDVIWLSPPCQSHSRMVKATRHKNKKYPDMSLYQEIIILKELFKGLFVVENVKPYYEPLIKPDKILGRHVFWTNLDIPDFEVPSPKGFIHKSNTKGANELKDWLGIHYEGNIYYKGNHCPCQVLRNCVHPDLGKHIFDCIPK